MSMVLGIVLRTYLHSMLSCLVGVFELNRPFLEVEVALQFGCNNTPAEPCLQVNHDDLDQSQLTTSINFL